MKCSKLWCKQIYEKRIWIWWDMNWERRNKWSFTLCPSRCKSTCQMQADNINKSTSTTWKWKVLSFWLCRCVFTSSGDMIPETLFFKKKEKKIVLFNVLDITYFTFQCPHFFSWKASICFSFYSFLLKLTSLSLSIYDFDWENAGFIHVCILPCSLRLLWVRTKPTPAQENPVPKAVIKYSVTY